MPIFFYWFRCTIRFWNSLLSSNNPLLEKIVLADLLLANRSDTWTYQVLHALQDLPTSKSFWMPYDLVRLSIKDSLNSLFVNISLGAGEILTFWHHMKLTIPAEIWGHITHISVYLWGILLDGGMTEKETKSLCCLSTFAWTFPVTSAEHFLAFAFLATTF